MTARATIVERDGYLEIESGGEASLENLLSVWGDIAVACARADCKRILLRAGMTGTPPTSVIYAFGDALKGTGLPEGSRVAIFASQKQFAHLIFAETVIANQGWVSARVFMNADRAVNWLLSD